MQPRQHPVPVLYRFLVGGCLLFPLWFINNSAVGGVATNLRHALLQGAFAAAATVLLVPVVIQGDWVEKLLAIVLLVLPVLSLVGAFLLAAGYS